MTRQRRVATPHSEKKGKNQGQCKHKIKVFQWY
jgi:hypothetical protein